VSHESEVTQEHGARPYQQIESYLEARFCAPLIAEDVVVKSTGRLWSPHDTGRGDITERVHTTKESIERTLELSRRLDEVLSRPIRWLYPQLPVNTR
jgi:hypothetical protein